MRRRNEKLWLGSRKMERRIRWIYRRRGIEGGKGASAEVEDKAVAKEVRASQVVAPFAVEKEAWQLSPPAIAPISRPLSASALSFQKQLEVVQQQPGQVSPPVPEPTFAAHSTSAPTSTSRNPNVQSALCLTFQEQIPLGGPKPGLSLVTGQFLFSCLHVILAFPKKPEPTSSSYRPPTLVRPEPLARSSPSSRLDDDNPIIPPPLGQIRRLLSLLFDINWAAAFAFAMSLPPDEQ
ncbi:hypothetical protein CPC08DRAFT_771086 [Agrocybe pediades]|nr:hypothetical protein CPC08DRAFT_771086 [Agrocybe pediades]